MYTLTHTTTLELQKKQRTADVKRMLCDLLDSSDSCHCDLNCGSIAEYDVPVYTHYVPTGEIVMTLKIKPSKSKKVTH